MSVSIENFVKTVYSQSQLQEPNTKIGNLAHIIGISSAAATDMAQKLAKKKLISYQKYKPLQLTERGEKMALNVIRKHRLWESFLHSTLQLNLHEIHEEAELLEHQTSDFLADKIEAFLNFPKVDPHGDPIPTEKGINSINGHALNETNIGKYTVVRLYSQDKDFFDFCERHHITIDSTIEVTQQFDDQSLTSININDTQIVLPFDLSKNIFVQPLENQS